MAESISGLTVVQLNEIKKWRAMRYSQGQIAKKMGLRQQKVSAAFKYLDGQPYV